MRRTVAQKTLSTRRSVVKEHGLDTEGGGKEGGFNTCVTLEHDLHEQHQLCMNNQ